MKETLKEYYKNESDVQFFCSLEVRNNFYKTRDFTFKRKDYKTFEEMYEEIMNMYGDTISMIQDGKFVFADDYKGNNKLINTNVVEMANLFLYEIKSK